MTRSAILKSSVLLAAVLLMGVLAFGGSKSTLEFDHAFHVEDVGAECTDCHIGVDAMGVGQVSGRPTHDNCAACHEDAIDEDCEYCHVEGNIPDEIFAADIKGYLYNGFAHDLHGDVDCSSCHMVEGMNVAMPGGVDCQTCHEAEEVLPVSHETDDWMSYHGYDAFASRNECAACHEQTTCDECHQGENVLAGTPHPPEWRFNHGMETMFGSECMACHETRDECVTCHKVMLPTPHDVGTSYANEINGGGHVADAEGFILLCISCHDVENDEPTCARCHN